MSDHIFISYAREDRAYASWLADALRQRDFDVWMDDRLYVGNSWWHKIDWAIRTCRVFVVVMTPDSEKSEWVRPELFLAIKLRKLIFPLLLRGEPFSALGDKQYDDVTGGQMPGQGFYDSLNRIFDTQGKPVPTSVGAEVGIEHRKKTASPRLSVSLEDIEEYEVKVERLRHILAPTDLSQTTPMGRAMLDILLGLALVNMPMLQARLKGFRPDVKEKLFVEAIDDLVRGGLVWRCSECPGSERCLANPPEEHFCLVQDTRLLEGLRETGIAKLSVEGELQFLNLLQEVSHHGAYSVATVPGTWRLERDHMSTMESEKDLSGLSDTEFQELTCQVLERATQSIEIASQYGGWVAKEPRFRDIISAKKAGGVEVTLAVDAPPAAGTNGYLEWKRWHDAHLEMGLYPFIRKRDWQYDTSLNMTIVEGDKDREALFFSRDCYSTRLIAPIYSGNFQRLERLQRRFQEQIGAGPGQARLQD